MIKHIDKYYTESVRVLGKQSDLELFVFWSGFIFLVVGMANNILYTLAQHHGLLPQPVGTDPADTEKQCAKHDKRRKLIWALKSAASFVFKILLLLWVLLSSFWFIQFGLLLVVAIVVDPFKPFTVIAVAATIAGYAKIAISSATSMRQRVKLEIQTRYLEKNKATITAKNSSSSNTLKKKTMGRESHLFRFLSYQ